MDCPSAVYALTKKPGVGGSLGEFEAGPNRTITRRAHVDTKPALLPAVLARVHLAPRIFVRHGRLSLVPDLYGSLPYTFDAAPARRQWYVRCTQASLHGYLQPAVEMRPTFLVR